MDTIIFNVEIILLSTRQKLTSRCSITIYNIYAPSMYFLLFTNIYIYTTTRPGSFIALRICIVEMAEGYAIRPCMVAL